MFVICNEAVTLVSVTDLFQLRSGWRADLGYAGGLLMRGESCVSQKRQQGYGASVCLVLWGCYDHCQALGGEKENSLCVA